MWNDLNTWLRQIRQFLGPGAAEADVDFRREILDLSHFSLRAIAGLEVVAPAVILVVRIAATSNFGVRATLKVSTLLALGTLTFLLARTRWARRCARLAATVSIWLLGALLMLGSGGHLLAARVFGPGRYLPVYVVIIMLLAVAMLPLRPGQTLALGSALEIVYLATTAGAPPEPAHHLFLVVDYRKNSAAMSSYADLCGTARLESSRAASNCPAATNVLLIRFLNAVKAMDSTRLRIDRGRHSLLPVQTGNVG